MSTAGTNGCGAGGHTDPQASLKDMVNSQDTKDIYDLLRALYQGEGQLSEIYDQLKSVLLPLQNGESQSGG